MGFLDDVKDKAGEVAAGGREKAEGFIDEVMDRRDGDNDTPADHHWDAAGQAAGSASDSLGSAAHSAQDTSRTALNAVHERAERLKSDRDQL